MEKIATEKSGSVRNQAIYFQLYESFISEMNVLTCSCIKRIKAIKKLFHFFNVFFIVYLFRINMVYMRLYVLASSLLIVFWKTFVWECWHTVRHCIITKN